MLYTLYVLVLVLKGIHKGSVFEWSLLDPSQLRVLFSHLVSQGSEREITRIHVTQMQSLLTDEKQLAWVENHFLRQ